MLFEVKPIDKQIYENEIKDFLPSRIIDIHTHIWLEHFTKRVEKRLVSWPSLVAKENSMEDLIATYQLLLPDKEVIPLVFCSLVNRQDDFEAGNNYVSKKAIEYNFPALIFVPPDWTEEELENKIFKGKFLGIKVMLSLVPPSIPKNDIKIFDYLPHKYLKVINKHGLIVMLHIPRDGRLKDPVNLEQMIEIEKTYPNIKLIIAHVGRAYCDNDVENAFEVLSNTKNMLFDICANTNANVFRQLIECVGPKRILFGSDLPILRMRMKRITENNKYVNLVSRKIFGELTNVSHMRAVEDEEAEKFTFFFYEEILAFKKAAEDTKLTSNDIADVFFNNAKRIINGTKKFEIK